MGGEGGRGEGQAKRSRAPPSSLPPVWAPGAAHGHPCPYKGGRRRGNERPPPARGARPCPRLRPPPAPRMERCVSNRPQREAGARGRRQRQERGSGPGAGPGLTGAAAAGAAARETPARGPAGPERPLGGPRDPGGAATGPCACPPPLPLAAGSRATCGQTSPRPPALGWRPAKLAAAPDRAAVRPEGAPCAARARPWPLRPRRGPRAAGRESQGPRACASSVPPRPQARPRARVGKLTWNLPDQFRPGARTGRRKLLQNFFGGCSRCPPCARAGCERGRVPRADRGARREERGGGAPAPLPWGYGHGDRWLGRPRRRRRHERCGQGGRLPARSRGRLGLTTWRCQRRGARRRGAAGAAGGLCGAWVTVK